MKPSPRVRAYLRSVGSKGGKKSRRRLDPAVARRMVALREARKAYHTHRHEYFWSSSDDLQIRVEHVPFIVRGLMNEGNRAAFEKARRIKRLMREDPPCR